MKIFANIYKKSSILRFRKCVRRFADVLELQCDKISDSQAIAQSNSLRQRVTSTANARAEGNKDYDYRVVDAFNISHERFSAVVVLAYKKDLLYGPRYEISVWNSDSIWDMLVERIISMTLSAMYEFVEYPIHKDRRHLDMLQLDAMHFRTGDRIMSYAESICSNKDIYKNVPPSDENAGTLFDFSSMNDPFYCFFVQDLSEQMSERLARKSLVTRVNIKKTCSDVGRLASGDLLDWLPVPNDSKGLVRGLSAQEWTTLNKALTIVDRAWEDSNPMVRELMSDLSARENKGRIDETEYIETVRSHGMDLYVQSIIDGIPPEDVLA